MLKPSTGRVMQSQTHFRLKLVGKGALCPAPMNPLEGRHVAAEKVEMMRRNRPTQQNFTRSRTCVYFWFRPERESVVDATLGVHTGGRKRVG